ncbi:hypothetical protein [Niabella aquatica]
MKEQNDDIFNHLKSVLQNHEELYDEGAWERFAAGNKPAVKRNAVVAMWKWAVAAAVIAGLILITGVFDTGKKDNINIPLAGDMEAHHQSADSNKLSGNNTLASAEQKEDIVSFDKKNSTVHNNNGIIVFAAPKTATQSRAVLVQPGPTVIPAALPDKSPETAHVPAIQELQAQQPEIDFWKNKIVEDNNQDQKAVLKDNARLITVSTAASAEKRNRGEKSSRWQPGIFISPLFGDLGVNMGYGFSLGYAINDKIRISSGIAHTKVTASRSYEGAASPSLGDAAMASKPLSMPEVSSASGSLKNTQRVMSSNSYVTAPQQISTLQQIDGSLSGIDIPVEVNYNIGKKLYASAGVSGLVVINDQRQYTYLDSRNEKVTVQSNMGGLKEDRSVMFNEQNVTSQPVTADEHIPFLGFYNLSVGFRQKISGRNAVSLEPFIKRQVKVSTRQNLNYGGAGIRLKFDF